MSAARNGDGSRDRDGSRQRSGRGARREPGAPRTGRYRVGFLYEDDDIVIVDKPSGLPTIAPEGSRTKCLYDIVTAHLRKRNPKGRAAVVHRLDRDTSGVIAFAKNARAKAALMAAWNDAVDERRYVALVEGSLPAAEGVLDSWLAELDPYRVKQVAAGTRGALRAVTRYRVLGEGDGLSLVELSLETGRRHQIRVQLAAAGCPVAGDERYGSRRDPLGRLGLHAASLSLTVPSGGEPIRVEAPPPPSFAAALRGAAASNAPASSGGSDGPATERPPRGSEGPAKKRSHRTDQGRPERRGRPDDRTRAWPGGGPSSRAGKPGADAGSRKSSSRYPTRTSRKP